MKRFTATKKTLLQKLRQLEVAVGAYQYDGKPIPQEALVPYITLNPRSLIRATKNSLIKFASLITEEYNGYDPHKEVLSEIQKAVSRRVYMDFDFDVQYPDNTISAIAFDKILNDLTISYIKTRGGVHALVKLENNMPHNWYNSMNAYIPDNKGTDTLIPIPGCTQGGYEPILIK